MLPFVFLTEVSSALMLLLGVAGAGLLLPLLMNRDSVLHRSLLMGATALLALRYLWWRATETLAPFGMTWDWVASSSLLVLEALAMLGALSSFAMLARVRRRSAEADQYEDWWLPRRAPKVAVLIATYNEELEVLERSIIGAQATVHADVEVLVLDDGRRDWLRDYCAAQGVRYLRRPNSQGAKAGNINHALARLAEDPEPPDFVATLDADFVPHRDFLRRTLALFHDPGVGLVQTPQHFFNADPIQHNLGLTRAYPDEQRFFFDDMQTARDGWGIAFCCGTSSVARWEALRAIEGLPTDSVTEDFLLTLALRDAGWATVYLDEPLTEGLAPEGLKEYITQRARWCLGLMQIVRSRMGPLARNRLRLRDRWSVGDAALHWLTTYPFRIAAIIFPLFYWYFGIIVVDATLSEVIAVFGVYYLWVMMVLNFLTGNKIVPVVAEVSQLLAAGPITRAAFTGLLRPRGQPFSVTAKGGDRSRVVVQWRLMMPFALLLGLTVVGLSLGLVFDRMSHGAAGDGMIVVLFWSYYNLVVLATTVLACIELPRREEHVADRPEPAVLRIGPGAPQRVWLADLARDTALVRGQRHIAGQQGWLRITGVGDVAVTVTQATPDGCRLRLRTDTAQAVALIRKFHTEGAAPGVAAARASGLIAGVARRLSA